MVDHAGIEVLEERACRELLAGEVVGRLALSIGGAPEIFPVNYDVRGDLVVFRSQAGSKVRAARGGRACLEIDGIDVAARSGWSVVAKGRLEEVTPIEARAWAQASALAPDPWADGERDHVLCLHVDRITGRRIRSAAS